MLRRPAPHGDGNQVRAADEARHERRFRVLELLGRVLTRSHFPTSRWMRLSWNCSCAASRGRARSCPAAAPLVVHEARGEPQPPPRAARGRADGARAPRIRRATPRRASRATRRSSWFFSIGPRARTCPSIRTWEPLCCVIVRCPSARGASPAQEFGPRSISCRECSDRCRRAHITTPCVARRARDRRGALRFVTRAIGNCSRMSLKSKVSLIISLAASRPNRELGASVCIGRQHVASLGGNLLRRARTRAEVRACTSLCRSGGSLRASNSAAAG